MRAATIERLKAFPSMTANPTAAKRPDQSGDRSQYSTDQPAGKPRELSPPSRLLDPAAGASGQTPLHAVLDERLHLLDEYDQTFQAFSKVSHPETSPEHQAALAAAELRQLEWF